jgi:ferredoxin
MSEAHTYALTLDDLQKLFQYFGKQGIENIGPVLRDGVIMLDTLYAFEDMPSGYVESLGKGSYSLEKSEDDSALFQHTLGPQSFKKFLNPLKRKLWTASKKDGRFEIHQNNEKPKNRAFWGVRSCDLSAFAILDKVFINDRYSNVTYRENRNHSWIIAVNCLFPSANCFCHSMQTGPRSREGFDFALTELEEADQYIYVCETGSVRAKELAHTLGFDKASSSLIATVDQRTEEVAQSMSRTFDPEETAALLKEKLEHQEWGEVAQRCLSCANCTMVCPTCFCSTTEDITDITGEHTERWLRWDSCFTSDFSFIHGGVIRNSTKSRYRQWLTHKLSSWYDQYGSAGCVGCGRCITWCPVGIDLVEEVEKLKNHEMELNESP